MEVKNGAGYTPYYYHADGLGSITGLSDATGTMVQTYSYDAFGNVTVFGSGNVAQPFAFTGREYDAETSMYFYRARYYDPQAGRFVTKDPIGFAGGDVNLSTYVQNDPINSVDPNGFAKQNQNTTYEPCKKPDWDVCKLRCGNKGVLACQVQRTKKIRRVKEKNGTVLERLDFDKTINCECGDDDCPKTNNEDKSWWRLFPPLVPGGSFGGQGEGVGSPSRGPVFVP